MLATYIRNIGPFRFLVALLATSVITFNLVTLDFQFADQISSVVAALLAVLSLGGLGNPSPKLTIEEGIRKIAEEVRDVWKEQERKRGLSDTSFIPLRVKIISGLDARHGEVSAFLATPAKSPLWNLEDMRRSCAAVVYRSDVRRVVIFGEEGTGKSTLAVALTLGLIERYFTKRGDLVPLCLSLNSWDARRDSFEDWLNRRLETTYPILRSFRRGPDGIARTLTNSEQFVFVLDSLDEIADGSDVTGALQRIEEFFPERQRLCILARDHIYERVRLRNTAKLRLCRSTRDDVRRYLGALSARDQADGGLDALRAAIRSGRAAHRSAIVRVLRTPLYLRSAYNAIIDENVTAHELLDTAEQGGERGLKERLLAAEVDRAFTRAPILQKPRALYWLMYMARDMERRNYVSYAWWRVGDAIPRAALAAMAASLIAPAYLLAIVMPVGLTRGLAIGAGTGAILGILRGYPVGLRHVAVAAPIAWVEVFILAVLVHPPVQAVADATQLAVAIGLVLLLKERLVVDRPTVAALTAVGIAAVTALVVSVVSQVTGLQDQYRSPPDIVIGVLFGIGIAVIAARLLIERPRTQMRASRIRLTPAPRITSPIWPILAAVLPASLIGVGGGIGGTIRYGQEYGLSLMYFFGLTIGVPVGLIGGLVKWLSLPLAAGSPLEGSSPSSVEGAPLRSDRIVALLSIVSLATAATGTIAIAISYLTGPLAVIHAVNSPGFSLEPAQGILYGLTMGVIVACFFTAWPTYFIAHMWLLCLGRRYPLQHQTFLDALVNANLMRNEGPLLYFRHRELQSYLGRTTRTVNPAVAADQEAGSSATSSTPPARRSVRPRT
ncbi:NACHT domain-containing protein [Pseudonocardia xinjiangensis]|uniref:NACHT domain-containing protein n=1 Tax=Pseudonocardia xinjiangensis TaxID=75289 RepID=A0ABX1R8T9_9PSEU|nr:hypothetical protein [Pseudonocardia xinjiangensis]NMH76803.1 hypothetical protein [Pseudonocardia xinjiangensis]